MAGTTIDEGEVVYAVLRRVTEEAGARYDDETFVNHMGTEKRSAVTALLAAGGVEATDERVNEVHGRFVRELAEAYAAQPPRPFPGVPAAFTALRKAGIKVALTTGYDRPTADLLLSALGWTEAGGSAEEATLDLVVCATEVPEGRPAPDMLRRVMDAFDITHPAEVIAVGDTPADLQAAHRAGVVGVGVLTGAADADTLGRQPHDHLLGSAAEVTGIAVGGDDG